MYRGQTGQQGFTLLEMMVALTIFSLIGMGAHVMLQSALRARESGRQHSAALAQLQKSMMVMTTDFTQMSGSGIATGTDNYAVSFIRRGHFNPLQQDRSSMLKVAYALENKSLKRYSWPLEAPDTSPQVQILLTNVSAFDVHLLPGAAEVDLTSSAFGPWQRIIQVPVP